MAWGPEEDFDFDGEHIKLKKIRAKPKPYGGTRPMIMNAGSTTTGQAFALRNCDAYFTATSASRQSVDATAEMVTEIRRVARDAGREIEVYTIGQVVCRPTQKEAEDYYRYAIIDNADWGAVDGMLANKSITPQTVGAEEFLKKREYFAAKAIGGYPFVGTPDHVAEEFANLSRAGVRGIAFSLINYLDEFPYFRDEVLPRLVQAGVRESS
jgi:alkanesulfonate monooxygenase SsuD/methylene tetrahydromethanopterin reductase-like flavin-dependent oxidoreductase (luciferase family)